EEIFPWTTPEEFRQAEPVPRREPGMRYFQPVHAEWIRFDGQMWRRDIDRQAWRATLAFYARLQEAPATWALTPENLQRVFLRREHELFAGVLRLLHGGR
ncbi:MAG TPA: hypothetical protein VEI97_10175, partial [bacterium]|nr:hypothetical protein [bacterium]